MTGPGGRAQVALFQPLKRVCVNEMLILAEAMRANGVLEPVFWLDSVAMTEAHHGSLTAAGFRVVSDRLAQDGTVWDGTPRDPSPAARLAGRALGAARKVPLVDAEIDLRRAVKRCGWVLDTSGASLVVVTSDRSRLTQRSLLATAQRRGIPTLVMPLNNDTPEGTFGGYERLGLSEIRRSSGRGASLTARAIAAVRPEQAYAIGDTRLLYDPPVRTLHALLRGVQPHRPWVTGGGRTTAVGVAGREMYDTTMRCGVPSDRVVITGLGSHDLIFRAQRERQVRRKELAARTGVDAGRPWIVFALPQLAEHGYVTWDEHWREIGSLVSGMSGLGAELLISLHPTSDPEAYRHLDDVPGTLVSPLLLRDLLPLGEVFVNSRSTTNAWGTLAGIPTVTFDFWGRRSDYLDRFAGIVQIDRREDLFPAVARVVSDEAHRQELASAQRSDSETFGRFDGRSTERLLRLSSHLSGCGGCRRGKMHDLDEVCEGALDPERVR